MHSHGLKSHDGENRGKMFSLLVVRRSRLLILEIIIHEAGEEIEGKTEESQGAPRPPRAAVSQGFLPMSEARCLRTKDTRKNTQKRKTCFRKGDRGHAADTSGQNKNRVGRTRGSPRP